MSIPASPPSLQIQCWVIRCFATSKRLGLIRHPRFVPTLANSNESAFSPLESPIRFPQLSRAFFAAFPRFPRIVPMSFVVMPVLPASTSFFKRTVSAAPDGKLAMLDCAAADGGVGGVAFASFCAVAGLALPYRLTSSSNSSGVTSVTSRFPIRTFITRYCATNPYRVNRHPHICTFYFLYDE
jgi:hypothetical protein